MKITDAKWAKLTWIYQKDFFLYESTPKSITSNEKAKSMRFTLRETTGKDPDAEFIIRLDKDGYFFWSDFFEDDEDFLDLTLFRSRDEIILFFEHDFGHGFFRLGE